MNKVITIIASVVLILAGLMCIINTLMNPICKVKTEDFIEEEEEDDDSLKNYKNCFFIVKKKDSTEEALLNIADYNKNLRNIQIPKIIFGVVMIIIGVLLLFKGKN